MQEHHATIAIVEPRHIWRPRQLHVVVTCACGQRGLIEGHLKDGPICKAPDCPACGNSLSSVAATVREASQVYIDSRKLKATWN